MLGLALAATPKNGTGVTFVLHKMRDPAPVQADVWKGTGGPFTFGLAFFDRQSAQMSAKVWWSASPNNEA